MKKLSLFLAAVSMLWVLNACGSRPQADVSTSTPEAAASRPAVPSAAPQPVQDNGPLGRSHILIAYFSLWDNAPWEQEGVDTSTSASVVVDESGASGTTRYVAQLIQKAVGGDITYCPANNTAAIFYAQSSRPNLTMTVYPIGKVTSDLSIFPDLPSRVEITFEVISK